MSQKNKAVFLDRDGVINKKRDDYVKSVNEFVFLPNVMEAIKILNNNGFLAIIVTNQSAVNREIISQNQLKEIHDYMLANFKKFGCNIDGIYFCPHRPDENCKCRKPQPMLLQRAIDDFQISVSDSWLIGDNITDIRAAEKIGLKSIKINKDGDIMEAVKKILE